MSKVRSDDPDFQRQMIEMAAQGVKPPTYVDIRPEHMSYWNAITEARANWTNIDLVHAANLARTLYMIEEETKMLDMEGSVVINQRGTQIANPRFSILEQLSRRSVALSAKIQVHAAATVGEVENTRKKNAVKQKAVKSAEMMDEDDLLAKPTVN